jgi:hypothetical protein
MVLIEGSAQTREWCAEADYRNVLGSFDSMMSRLLPAKEASPVVVRTKMVVPGARPNSIGVSADPTRLIIV